MLLRHDRRVALRFIRRSDRMGSHTLFLDLTGQLPFGMSNPVNRSAVPHRVMHSKAHVNGNEKKSPSPTFSCVRAYCIHTPRNRVESDVQITPMMRTQCISCMYAYMPHDRINPYMQAPPSRHSSSLVPPRNASKTPLFLLSPSAQQKLGFRGLLPLLLPCTALSDRF